LESVESEFADRQGGGMKTAAGFAIVLVTAPNVKSARRLAQLGLKARLVACANIVPGLKSHYWWQNRIETSTETLLLLKTRRTNLARLEKLILEEHPYDTPEFLVVGINKGNGRYLHWLGANC
jgi:periplasmic divalent cation tolerance protein